MMATLFWADIENPLGVTMLLFVASFGMAFSNVVIDAILVVQARRDKELGSQDLLSIAFMFQGIGGVIGCIIAAFMMDEYHPKYGFLAYGINGVILFFCCFFLSRESENELNEGEVDEFTIVSSEVLSG